MSEQTAESLDDAIRAHIADEYDNSLTSSWVVIAESIPLEDDGYSHIVDVVAEGQSTVTTIGLAYFMAQQRAGAGERA